MAMPRRLPPLPLAVMWRVEAPEGAVDTAMHQTDGHAHRYRRSLPFSVLVLGVIALWRGVHDNVL